MGACIEVDSADESAVEDAAEEEENDGRDESVESSPPPVDAVSAAHPDDLGTTGT